MPFPDIAADPVLGGWSAVRVRFVRRSFPVPPVQWNRFVELLAIDVGEHARALDAARNGYRWERQIQEQLAKNAGPLRRHLGLALDLVGQEHRLRDRRRIDLLFTTGRGLGTRDVIVELKRERVGRKAVDQVLGYRSALRREAPRLRRPIAVLVGTELDDPARRAVDADRRLEFLSLGDLGIRIATPH